MPIRASSLGQASPSLECLDSRLGNTGLLFINRTERGKIVMTKTSRCKVFFLGSFLVPEIHMIFGDGVGASLEFSKLAWSVEISFLQ